ncbi:hypothetical protein MTBPR1_30252 [Candidatus Terasakiella magnetica]|uniref:Uncharacterized protein n=1 Tax=Candidatus Terasakiella magnetica TaxID=1867952 RepID=A0A1C3RI37_9PROT|nr:hypothetical protein MTBPR1_30252 [Candidatus Terasakiella magnetica]
MWRFFSLYVDYLLNHGKPMSLSKELLMPVFEKTLILKHNLFREGKGFA